MQPSLTVVTTTRNRPDCLRLLDLYLSRQTRQPDQWLIIDDGSHHYEPSLPCEVHFRDPTDDVLPSIRENWLFGLPLIRCDAVVCCEDDCWYHPGYLERCAQLLDGADLVGFRPDPIYRVPDRRWVLPGNWRNCALAGSAWSVRVNPLVEHICQMVRAHFIDAGLWQTGQPRLSWRLEHSIAEDGLRWYVNLKGLPGAAGYDPVHRVEFGEHDVEGILLDQWMNRDNAELVRGLVVAGGAPLLHPDPGRIQLPTA